MEGMHRARYQVSVQSFHSLSGCATLSKSPSTWTFFKLLSRPPSPFWFLWKVHDKGMIDESWAIGD